MKTTKDFMRLIFIIVCVLLLTFSFIFILTDAGSESLTKFIVIKVIGMLMGIAAYKGLTAVGLVQRLSR